jgi:hypothetical protein
MFFQQFLETIIIGMKKIKKIYLFLKKNVKYRVSTIRKEKKCSFLKK